MSQYRLAIYNTGLIVHCTENTVGTWYRDQVYTIYDLLVHGTAIYFILCIPWIIEVRIEVIGPDVSQMSSSVLVNSLANSNGLEFQRSISFGVLHRVRQEARQEMLLVIRRNSALVLMYRVVQTTVHCAMCSCNCKGQVKIKICQLRFKLECTHY